jgi:acyl carrier protein
LAAFREDGRVDFYGRVDHQVKIRGHRIELGEIEADLTQEPSVREAVVVSREDIPGDQRLVAYVVPSGNSPIDVEGIRVNLRKKLPEYMVPGQFVVLDEFPMTPNKKVDRNALPRPDERAVEKTLAASPPENEVQTRIAEIWQNNLGIAQVGIDENFFDLGGHSLLAVKVHRDIKDALSCEITITDLFRYPTINALANHLNVGAEETEINGNGSGISATAERLDARQQRRSARQDRLQRRRSIRLRQEKPR